jgi:hypothetical protein
MLARADSTDPSAANLQLVFLSLLILGAAAFLGFLIVRAARLRTQGRGEAFVAFAVLWVALTAGTAIHDLATQLTWSRERTARIESGYYDPADAQTDAPHHSWALYAAEAVGYAVLWLTVTQGGRKTTAS